MRKVIAFVLAMVLALSLAACGEYNVPFRNYKLDKADLSQETLEWLEWFNGLSEEDQNKIDYCPMDITDALNRGYYRKR